jgi:hypothetical protein
MENKARNNLILSVVLFVFSFSNFGLCYIREKQNNYPSTWRTTNGYIVDVKIIKQETNKHALEKNSVEISYDYYVGNKIKNGISNLLSILRKNDLEKMYYKLRDIEVYINPINMDESKPEWDYFPLYKNSNLYLGLFSFALSIVFFIVDQIKNKKEC